MLMNIVWGLSTMIVCLLAQTSLLVRVLRFYNRHKHTTLQGDNHPYRTNMIILSATMLMLVVGNLAQVALWALLFVFLGEFSLFSESFYFSAVNFATLGYGEIIMSDQHKLLGPLEAINGILMVGLSTSSLILVLQDVGGRVLRQAPQE